MRIQLESDFSPAEVSLLNMHSVCNVLNVVQFELLRLSTDLGNISELEQLAEALQSLVEDLSKPEKAINIVRAIEDYESEVLDVLEKALPEESKESEMVLSTLQNLNGIFEILKLRAKEIDARWDNPMDWISFEAEALRQNFVDVFHAIEANSHGAYHIVFNLAAHEEGDYLVNLDVDAKDGDLIWMPMIFQDVMRDLMANARKYTAPGGRIYAGLFLDEKYLNFVVEDSGMGIAPEEIQKVVQFGYRSPEVKNRPTMGGGFGLSKAYYVSQLFGGTMDIESPLEGDRGTRVQIRLPRKSA